MKAISIGYSTEDAELFLDEIPDLQQYRFLNQFLDNLEWSKIENIEEELERLTKEALDVNDPFVEEQRKTWDENLAKFRAAIKDQSGTFVGWSVEYDDNIMFVFDATMEQMQEQLHEHTDEEYNRIHNEFDKQNKDRQG